ncbi:MAG: DUF2442 domain-containing protein [Bacteroidota bacterium]
MEPIIFPSLVSVRPIEPYILWVEYSDGTSGKVDLSYLVGSGVFAAWNDVENFNKVHIGEETGALEWNEEIDICPDSVYLDLKQKTFEEYAQNK